MIEEAEKDCAPKILFLISGSDDVSAESIANLSGQISEIALQSAYAPSRALIDSFISDVFNRAKDSREKKILLLLRDDQDRLLGFSFVRFFCESAELDFILVDQSMRRLGYARKMMDVIFAQLRNNQVEKLFLEVGIHNQNATKLYGELGFQKLSLRKSYYKSGEDALVMEKIL